VASRGSRRHLIANRKLELAIGIAGFVASSLLIRDAYEGRGVEMPWPLRPFSWW